MISSADALRHTQPSIHNRNIVRISAFPLVILFLFVALASSTLASSPAENPHDRPYMGWSSWSLSSAKIPGVNPRGDVSWLKSTNLIEQARIMADTLKDYGYEYFNIDCCWYYTVDHRKQYDEWGRPTPDTGRFPLGISLIADYLQQRGLKLGMYLGIGLEKEAYNNGETPVYGTEDCFTRHIVYSDLRTTNGWDSAYKMDFTNPCAEAYIDSLAVMFADWGVDFIKLDGVGPGSFRGGAQYDNTQDIKAWHSAIAKTGRPMHVLISWSISRNEMDTWQEYANSWRIDRDVECYCETLTSWDVVSQRFYDVVPWIDYAGPGGWNNLDSLLVGVGSMDGLTEEERQSYMTLWAISASPLYIGDDLTKLDSFGLSLLTNREVIAINQAGRPARPLSQTTDQQVWYIQNNDGSIFAALFNLSDSPEIVTLNWADLGIEGRAMVRDLWGRTDLGEFSGQFDVEIPSHGSRLFKLTRPAGLSTKPSMPMKVEVTGTTATSIDLSWIPSFGLEDDISHYVVYSDTEKVSTAIMPSVRINDLKSSQTYHLTVAAVDFQGQYSMRSTSVIITTPSVNGPQSYEAEAPQNKLSGNADIVSCANCSGHRSVRKFSGNGHLTIENVTVPQSGTYLMSIAYVNGQSSRTAEIIVAEKSINVVFPGTNDGDWGHIQTLVVPVELNAGTNAITFSNPAAYGPLLIDKISL